MQKPALPLNESLRLKTLQSLNVLDTPAEQRFDRYTQAMSKLFNVPIALVSLIDQNRQWFKAKVGLAACQTDRDILFCGHAILQADVFVVEDAQLDARFKDNPLVTGDPHIRFYAGCPLVHPNGSTLGTLCMIDRTPRQLDDQDLQVFQELAMLVTMELIQLNQPSMDLDSNLSSKEGFFAIAEPCLAMCCKADLPAAVAFVYVKGLMSAKRDPQRYQQVLAELGLLIKQYFQSSHVLGRYDDSSFVALLVNEEIAKAEQQIEQLLAQGNTLLKHYGCSVLAGVVAADPEHDLKRLLYLAFADLHD